uniref:WD repeat-containing protein 54 beta-propeller domain-containing protein n=1 Tax=Ditylenchus dipsaci TaxID=166011 RepID=A0A915DLX3_9BILA
MYEPDGDFTVKTGAAFLANNLSVFKHELKAISYAAFLGKNALQLLSWNDKMEQISCDLLSQKELANGAEPTVAGAIDSLTKESPSSLMQVKMCLPVNRTNPVAVLLSTTNLNIIDPKSKKVLFATETSSSIDTENEVTGKFGMKPCTFTRGIGCVDNIIMAGLNSGEITLITCSGESNFQQQKKLLKEHNAPVTDIATCGFDMITVSGDVQGNVVVWSKNMKSAAKKISTNQQLSVLNVLRKQVLCGTYLGQILIFSVNTGALMAEVNAHSRQITSITVAVESAYILSASEDSYIRIWKLHTRKPEAYKVEFRFAQKFENMSIMGAEFSGARGSGFLVSHYENSKIFSFRINRKKQVVQKHSKMVVVCLQLAVLLLLLL